MLILITYDPIWRWRKSKGMCISEAAQDVKVAFKEVRDIKPTWFSTTLQAQWHAHIPVCVPTGGFGQILLKKCKEYEWVKDYDGN